MTSWSFDDIPDQTGRTAIVTGANSGIGLETARMLAKKGASVVLACRNPEKGRAALEGILAEGPKGSASLSALDLSDLDSVAAFADGFSAQHDRLDLLIDNAGVMVPPLGRTKQGFELQFGTNHLGHFALTGRLLPLVMRTAGARVVVVSSIAHRTGRIDLGDLSWQSRGYSAWTAYGQSKLANLMFTLELSRRLSAVGSGVIATAAHPGWTATELQKNSGIAKAMGPLLAMKPAGGALPTLRAATDPSVESGSYWGPSGLFELRGAPAKATISKAAKDERMAADLWAASEKLTGVTFDFGQARRAAA